MGSDISDFDVDVAVACGFFTPDRLKKNLLARTSIFATELRRPNKLEENLLGQVIVGTDFHGRAFKTTHGK
ncbi:hypothetical protein SDC9_15463 [bioreactor metagenome]|uniref:Uncharacterized protein n=1 Tax=bioreactor metagenome TaxID=1076179 RepID=A0A644TS70_9ZZZZ|nr:hypothetical protein [Lentimicrobium sp.]MEA5110536.1 hypothetical protein [Lentimicrobium sp.]